MDYITFIFQVINDFRFLLLIFFLLALLTAPLVKGWLCLCMVNLFSCLLLNKKKYHPITNITLPSENGVSLIDHIIVSVYGLFVVKTVKMKGCISGDPSEKGWTQKLYTRTNKFQNPLSQNNLHVRTLQSILGLKDNQIHSVVLFTGGSNFKTDMPESVTRGLGFIRFIKSKTRQVLSVFEVMEIKIKIIDIKLAGSFEEDRKRNENIGNIGGEKENRKIPQSAGG